MNTSTSASCTYPNLETLFASGIPYLVHLNGTFFPHRSRPCDLYLKQVWMTKRGRRDLSNFTIPSPAHHVTAQVCGKYPLKLMYRPSRLLAFGYFKVDPQKGGCLYPALLQTVTPPLPLISIITEVHIFADARIYGELGHGILSLYDEYLWTIHEVFKYRI
jgi:hypothetical protein